MNVFVLCTGRCGSVTFSKACGHITNYTSGHETRLTGSLHYMGVHSVNHPERHIEVNPQLIWRLGWLAKFYDGKPVYYVHLKRDEEAVARSYFNKFYQKAQGVAWAWWVLVGKPKPVDATGRKPLSSVFFDMVVTMNLSIETYLKNRPHMTIDIENPKEKFREFWNEIGAEGNLDAALGEFDTHYNTNQEAA